MSVFTDIAAKVDAFAEEAKTMGAKALHEIIDTVTEGAADALEAAEPVVERSLLALVENYGGIAAALVVSVESEALRGSEKANLAATSLIEAAFKRGTTIVEADASTLIKNAFTAAETYLRAVA